MKTSSATNSHSEDVENLLNQYSDGLKSYHEIRLQDSLDDIRQRWPLLEEINQLEDKK